MTRIALLAALLSSSAWPVAAAAHPDGLEQVRVAPPAKGSACSLMTRQEAATALGVAVGKLTEKPVPDTPELGTSVWSCGYDGPGSQSINLTVAHLPPALAPSFKKMCETKSKDGLEGLGDLACWLDDKHQELHAFKSATFLSIRLQKSGDSTAALKGVMKKALARLK